MKLYRFQQTAAGGHWDLLSANADVNFYNINEDTASKKAKWHLEIGTDMDIAVTDQFSVDLAGKRVTVAAEGSDVYAVKFPSTATLHLFEQEYNHKLFENTYEMEYNAKNKDQVQLSSTCHLSTCVLTYCMLTLSLPTRSLPDLRLS